MHKYAKRNIIAQKNRECHNAKKLGGGESLPLTHAHTRLAHTLLYYLAMALWPPSGAP